MSDYKFICQYCSGSEQSKVSATHHVCNPSVLRERIDGLMAHMKMWHTEAMRMARKYNEDTFYHPVSKNRKDKEAA